MAKLAIDGGEPVIKRKLKNWPVFGEGEKKLICKLLDTGQTKSPKGVINAKFEKRFAEWNGTKHAITCNSGTSAIFVALAACEIGAGDEVIVPPRTFIGTVTPVLQHNAVPVFADIDPKTHNISPDSIRKLINKRTKAIIPVHLAGTPCDMDEIMEIAREHDLYVVEDCAQAHGAEYKGRKVGSIGHINAFSFANGKIITTAGDGGMVVTNDDRLALIAREFHNHGFVSGLNYDELYIYIHPRLGYNLRMTELQAAVGLHMMDRVDKYIQRRRENALYLTEELSKIDGIEPVYEPEGCKCSYYNLYSTIQPDKFTVDRDQFVKALIAEGVRARIGTNPELYREKMFQEKSHHSWDPRIYDGDVSYKGTVCPVAHDIGKRSTGFLVNPTYTMDDMKDFVKGVKKVAGEYRI